MSEIGGTTRVGLALALLLASLSVVAWRQGRALEALGTLDRVQREIALAEAERAALARSIQFLESRGRVVPAAEKKLGMHVAEASEQAYLEGDGG